MKRLLAIVIGVPLLAVAYRALVRGPILNWGARPDEVAARLPGDELMEAADMVSTRAITIDAPPSAIWPWLLQMGPGRGGAYTYDWIENLFGLNMHSADDIVPEWQSMNVGDTWRNPNGAAMRIEIVEPERVLAMRAEDGSWVWSFVIRPEGERTRFISRNRFPVTGGLPTRLAGMYLMVPGSLVMERKMLLGIKTRAERLAGQLRSEATPATGPEPTSALEPELATTSA